MRIIRTSGLTLSSAPFSPAATNCMSREYRAQAGPLLRTSAMLGRQPQARVPIPARVAEHQHRRLRLQLQLRLQRRPRLQLQLRPQLQLQRRPRPRLQRRQQLQHRPERRLRQGLVGLRHRGHSGIRNNFVGEADSFPYRWFLTWCRTVRARRQTAMNKSFSTPRPGRDLALAMTFCRRAGMWSRLDRARWLQQKSPNACAVRIFKFQSSHQLIADNSRHDCCSGL